MSGTYTVTATLSGCHSSATTTAVVNPTIPAPTVQISVSPGDSVCDGIAVTFTANVTNGGSSPTYQWRKNGTAISGATSATYTETSALNNYDIVTCFVTANADCQPVNTGISNSILMHVVSFPMPGISIQVYPLVFSPGDTMVFTAVVTNGNPVNLSFQWLKNGGPIAGATSSTYTSSSLGAGDQISLYVTSNKPCTVPDTLVTGSINLAVGDVNSTAGNIEVYPNPNNGTFTMTSPGLSKGEEVLIYNIVGQKVYSSAITEQKKIISLDVPAGVYTVVVRDETGAKKVQQLIISK
jgi:Secretion system C-terminal sorting domain